MRVAKLWSLKITLLIYVHRNRNDKGNRRHKKERKMNSPSIKGLETEYWSFSASDFPC